MFRLKAQQPSALPPRTSLQGFIAPSTGDLLPPQEGSPRKTLVLDLDRTLIDCIVLREPSISEPDFIYTDDLGTQAKVWMRPFLKQFLAAVARDYEVVLFTAAGARHADSVLQVIDPKRTIFSHRLYGQHTTESRQWGWVKDLSRLGRPLNQTLLVDDSTLAALNQPCNLVPIRPFIHSNPKKDWDTALSELLRFLQDKVLPAADVRHAIALNWNKVTRRPRKSPLQPQQHNSCTCSCHAHRTASLPPQNNWFFTSWAQFLSGRPNQASNTTASITTRGSYQPQTQAVTAANKLPMHNGWTGQGLHTQNAVATHAQSPGILDGYGSSRGRCAAANDGCGCNFAEGDHAVVAAAAAYDMRACHADDDEDDVDSGSTGTIGCGCGCCPSLGGNVSNTDASALFVRRSLKRSPKALEQLSGDGATAVAASAATLISKLSVSTASSYDSRRESIESFASATTVMAVSTKAMVLVPDALRADMPSPAPAPTPVAPSRQPTFAGSSTQLSQQQGDPQGGKSAATVLAPTPEPLATSPWSTPLLQVSFTPRADSGEISTDVPQAAPLTNSLSLPAPGCWYEGRAGERLVCIGNSVSDAVLQARGDRPLQCVAALSKHHRATTGGIPTHSSDTHAVLAAAAAQWEASHHQGADLCPSPAEVVEPHMEGRVRAGRVRTSAGDAHKASFARVSCEQVTVTVT